MSLLDRFSRALLVLPLVIVVSCGEGTPVGSAEKGAGIKASKAAREAEKTLQAEFKKYFTKCGAFWVSKRVKKNPYPHDTIYYQIANLEFSIDEQELAGADKLNGLTFLGHISFGEEASYRSFKNSVVEGVPWYPITEETYYGIYGYLYKLIELNGVWDFSHAFPPQSLSPDGLETATCAEVR